MVRRIVRKRVDVKPKEVASSERPLRVLKEMQQPKARPRGLETDLATQ